MPTNRDGDKTATQSPSVKPQPEGPITMALPADGDPPNASTYLQAFKVAEDWIDWLLKPVAKVSAWVGWILSFRTAAGHKRWTIDHFGLPAGRLVHWREDWARGVGASGTTSTTGLVGGIGSIDLEGTPLRLGGNLINDISTAGSNLSNAGAAGSFAGAQPFLSAAGAALTDAITYLVALQEMCPWKIRILKTTGTGSVSFFPADSGGVTSRHRYVAFISGDTSNDYAVVYRKAPCNYSADVHIAMEWQAQLEATGMGGNLTACMGLCRENTIPQSAGGSSPDYVVFEKGPSGNWFIRYRSGGGTAQGIDTTVAATTSWTRFRIEFHGENVADNATRALRCYINGTQVGGDITTNIPVIAAEAAPTFALVSTAIGPSGLTIPLRLGPVNFAHNLYGSDVV